MIMETETKHLIPKRRRFDTQEESESLVEGAVSNQKAQFPAADGNELAARVMAEGLARVGMYDYRSPVADFHNPDLPPRVGDEDKTWTAAEKQERDLAQADVDDRIDQIAGHVAMLIDNERLDEFTENKLEEAERTKGAPLTEQEIEDVYSRYENTELPVTEETDADAADFAARCLTYAYAEANIMEDNRNGGDPGMGGTPVFAERGNGMAAVGEYQAMTMPPRPIQQKQPSNHGTRTCGQPTPSGKPCGNLVAYGKTVCHLHK